MTISAPYTETDYSPYWSTISKRVFGNYDKLSDKLSWNMIDEKAIHLLDELAPYFLKDLSKYYYSNFTDEECGTSTTIWIKIGRRYNALWKLSHIRYSPHPELNGTYEIRVFPEYRDTEQEYNWMCGNQTKKSVHIEGRLFVD